MTPTLERFDTETELVRVLCTRVVNALKTAIAQRGVALLVVSGGRTPLRLFQALSRQPLAWDKVWITLADERWVDPTHADSNARLVRENLLQANAAAAHFVGLKTEGALPVDDALSQIRATLDRLPWPVDMALLGMGTDGHTASFFPGSQTLDAALEPESTLRCVAIRPPAAMHERVTLTLATLLQSRAIVLHIVGAEKNRVLQQALKPGPANELPVRGLIHQTRVPLTVYYAAQE